MEKTIKKLFRNETQEVLIEITDAGANFYLTDIYYREKGTNKKFKRYNACDGIYEGIKNLEKSIKGFCKRHNLVEVK